jgi:hypothetical protein
VPDPLALASIPIGDVATLADGATLTIVGRIRGVDGRLTHHRDPWAVLTLAGEDDAEVSVNVFPQLHQNVARLLTVGATVRVAGRYNADKATGACVYAQEVSPC